MKVNPPINLQKRFGKTYKVVYEESYYAERTKRTVEDPWLMMIPGKYGHIFPHGDNLLAVSVDGHPQIATRIKRLTCCKVHQDGDFGKLTSIFDVADFKIVADVIRARRRRVLSDEQRAELVERGKRLQQFKQATQGAT